MRLALLFTSLLTVVVALCQFNASPDVQRRDLVSDTANAIISAIENAAECTGCQVSSSTRPALLPLFSTYNRHLHIILLS
jgi:hypothetical protein